MAGGQVFENCVNNSFRHHYIQLGECLLGVPGLHCLDNLLVVLGFLSGELTHSTLRKYSRIVDAEQVAGVLHNRFLHPLGEITERSAEAL